MLVSCVLQLERLSSGRLLDLLRETLTIVLRQSPRDPVDLGLDLGPEVSLELVDNLNELPRSAG